MSQSLTDLPDDVADAIQPHLGDDEAPPVLDAIGVAIAEKREEAKAARKSSGIEEVWREAEEAYVGVDDANRHEFNDMRWAKPTSIDGPVTTGRKARNTDHKSTVYLRLTSRYVDAGAAKLGEILLPADDRAFSFSEMPIPEVIEAKDNDSQVVHSGLGVLLTRPLAPGETLPAQPVAAPAPAVPGQPAPVGGMVPPGVGGAPPVPAGGAGPAGPPAPARVPLTAGDLALENIEMARKRAKAAETRFYDWMVGCKYRAELRKSIFDASRIGVGIVKSPTPKSRRVVAAIRDGDEVKVIIRQKIVPAMEWKDPWNIFPDPACGESIHDGDFVFERDYMGARQVRGLKKLPGYIATQIDRVLDEGPDKVNADGDTNDRGPPGLKNKNRFEVWYFYGTLTGDEMASINAAAGQKPSGSGEKPEQVHAIVTLINDSVVRAVINPLDSGSFPYDSVPWQRRAQHWAGIGVGEQLKAPQRIINAALRAMLNNAGKSAGTQIVMKRGAIVPADNRWDFTPDKIWYATDDAGQDVRQAFWAFQIPNVTDQLMKIIVMGERLAEETTSIPMITQGQSGATTPDTFGATQLQNNNANQLLRSIGYSFDDYFTEPAVRRLYEWLLLDPDVPNEEKGEWQIDAHGSAALVERAIEAQAIGQIAGMAENPIWGLDPKKCATLLLKSKRLDPQAMQYTPEEQEKIAAAPPPEAPAVTVAKVNADATLKVAIMRQQGDAQSLASEEKIEAAANVLEGGRVQNEQHRTAVDATVRLHELKMQHDLALLEYANHRNISLDSAKADLAKTAMTVQAQRDLNTQDNAADLARAARPARPPRGMRPPGQVPGRAGNGRAFEQAPA